MVALLDHKKILNLMAYSETKSIDLKTDEKKPASLLTKPNNVENIKSYSYDMVSTRKDKTFDLKSTFEIILQKMQDLIEIIERKTLKIEKLENEIEERRKKLVKHEEMFADRFIHYKQLDKYEFGDKKPSEKLSLTNQIFIKDDIKNHLVIDESANYVAVVQRGILKQVSKSFAELLGYEINDLINKNLLVFYAPRGIENVKNYHLGKLRGINLNTYKTVFVKKDSNEVPVEIFVKPTIYNGESAEILVIKENNNN
jgi:PAS domain S-box-containing protein